MPTWSGILDELHDTVTPASGPDVDGIRRKYLAELYHKTDRNVILYATAWTQAGKPMNPDLISIVDEDVQGLMEVIHGLSGSKLDLILHSPGGDPSATEAFVTYLRTKFDDIRVIIPYAAMSAGTMLACSANKIVLGKHSFLGPVDPQMIISTQTGLQAVPAQAILDQFKNAQDESKTNPDGFAAWIPLLNQYHPGLLQQCENAQKLSKELVSKWLSSYMLNGTDPGAVKSKQIAEFLADHIYFKTHSRHITRDEAKSKGLVIENLEEDQEFQELVLSIFHATTHTLSITPAVKIIENHLGKSFIRSYEPTE